MQPTTPPTNNPNIPSFQHALYREVLEDLIWVQDVLADLKGCKAEYLPQEEKEPPKAYLNRIGRTQFDNRFSPAVKGHSGLLSDFTLTDDTPQSIRDYQKDCDRQGNSLKTFLTEADETVLADGGCGILVEYPKTEDAEGNAIARSAADEKLLALRPYLVLINRRNILNWDIEYRNGEPFLNFVVLREAHTVREGLFGSRQQIHYRILYPGRFEEWKIKSVQGEWKAVLVDEGRTNLERVPLVWYSISENKIFQSAPPFMNLARLNIEHYQKRSGLNEVLHKCNLPVPVRKGFIKSIQDLLKPIAKLVIGPNSVVDIPMDGDFFFAEPTGNAIAATQADIAKLEASMDRISLAFITGGDAQKTATEVMLHTAQTQATLMGMAERKRSAVEQIFDLWAQYTGEDSGGSIEVSAKVLQLPPNPQEVQIILDAMGLKISNQLGLQMLLSLGWLPQDADIEAEVNMLEGMAESLDYTATLDPAPQE
jgi:Domain of unknown function (DUF4055)